MKSPLLVHGIWLVLAAGAFAAGRMSLSKSDASGRSTSAVTVPTSPPSPTANASTTGAKAAGENPDDPAVWAKQYRGSDGKISAEKMTAAIQAALRDSDPARSMMNFAQLLKELTPENGAAAFKAVRETVTGFEAMRYMPMLAYSWGAIDGENALKALRDTAGREGMFSSAATLAGWASADPEAAKKWLTENGSAENAGFLNRALVTGLARNDLEAATQYVMGLKEDERAQYVDVLLEQKMKGGMPGAADWAKGLSDPKMQAQAMERVAAEYARQDVTTAAEWVKQFAGEPYAKDTVGSVAREFAGKDPTSALAWAKTLPLGDSQTEAYGRVFREWARSDATAASESLNSLPAGASKDSAIGSFTRSIARENPEDAITWAASISDAGAREEAQIEVVQRWRMSNPEAATQWSAANLSAEAQQKAASNPRFDWRGGGGGPFGGGGPPPGFGGGGPPR